MNCLARGRYFLIRDNGDVPLDGIAFSRMVTPVFDLEQTLSTSLRLIRRASAIWALHMLKMG